MKVCPGCWLGERCHSPETCPCCCNGDHEAWIERMEMTPVRLVPLVDDDEVSW